MEIKSFLLGRKESVPNKARVPLVIYRAALEGGGNHLAERFEARGQERLH